MEGGEEYWVEFAATINMSGWFLLKDMLRIHFKCNWAQSFLNLQTNKILLMLSLSPGFKCFQQYFSKVRKPFNPILI
ncbi:MAG: hypothetical protein U5L07_14620 [Desulfobacterales bacterium]|nr:hypothetical protein [Desulfobacterales bacterium]